LFTEEKKYKESVLVCSPSTQKRTRLVVKLTPEHCHCTPPTAMPAPHEKAIQK
jgi:hypothetical protein